MAKAKKSVYFCQNCGHEETKWLGQCPACREWNTFVEEKVTPVSAKTVKERRETRVVTLSGIKTDEDDRMLTGIEELDRVLGGGIVKGSLVLVGRDREIHTAFAGLPAAVFSGPEAIVYIGRGVAEADQAQGEPHGRIYRESVSSVRDEP